MFSCLTNPLRFALHKGFLGLIIEPGQICNLRHQRAKASGQNIDTITTNTTNTTNNSPTTESSLHEAKFNTKKKKRSKSNRLLSLTEYHQVIDSIQFTD